MHKGNFTLLVHAYNEKDKLVTLRGYEFTLFESHIRALRGHTEGFKFGAGIYYAVTGTANSAWARLRPIEDKKRLNTLHERHSSRL